MATNYKDALPEEINRAMEQSWQAFHVYRKFSLKQRAEFMRAIATELENSTDEMVKVAMSETNLPEPRLKSEFTRTQFQLKSYADACEEGSWL